MGKFKHHSTFPKVKALQSFRYPFVCFLCRKAFKFPANNTSRVCPQCRTPMEMLSRKFSAPRTTDTAQWKKVQFLVEHGFRFYSIYEPTEDGGLLRVKYSETLQEAAIFVRTFKPPTHQQNRYRVPK